MIKFKFGSDYSCERIINKMIKIVLIGPNILIIRYINKNLHVF